MRTRCPSPRHPGAYGRSGGYGHPGRRGRRHHPFRPAGVLVLIMLAAIVLGGPEATILALVLGTPMLSVLIAGGAVVTVALAGGAAYRRRVRYHPIGPDPSARVAPAPEPRRPMEHAAGWRAARRRFDTLREEYARYECDPLAVLRLPALADVGVPATARFVDAFAEAQALHTEEAGRVPAPEVAGEYVEAVDRAERAWRAARGAAERIRLAGLHPEERAAVARVVRLLTVAGRTGHEAERMAAYARARAELARLERAGHVQLPRPASETLERAARGHLTAAPGT